MCNFPAMEGVCDTPLHMFGENADETVVESTPIRLQHG